MRIKAVIDTNVLVASLITSIKDSPTVKIINYSMGEFHELGEN